MRLRWEAQVGHRSPPLSRTALHSPTHLLSASSTDLDVLLESLPLKLDHRVVTRTVSVILGKESHGRLIATVEDAPARTLKEESIGKDELQSNARGWKFTYHDDERWDGLEDWGRHHDQPPLIFES